ncbi:MAG: tetratricopeptide repeat protein [Planctomycetes bacterium]|nr:tetratricopeptide repeat protein [Planctomycetota bacterium]
MRLARLKTRLPILLATFVAAAVTLSAVKGYVAYRSYIAASNTPDASDARWELLNRAIRLAPGNALYHRAAARESMRAAEADLKANHTLLKQAEDHLQAALKAEPTNAAGYFELGNCNLLKGDPGQAEKAYDQALKLAPCNANFHEQVGRQHLKRGGNQQWISPFRRAVELDPTRLPAVFDAIWTFTHSAYELRRFAGDDWALRIASVRFLREKKEHSAALRECISLCRQATDAPDNTKQQLATLLNHMRQHLMAVFFLRRWLKKTPKSYILRRELAVSLRSGGKTDEAVQIAGELVKERPSDHAAHMLLGDLFHRKGDLNAAEEEFQKGIDLNPHSIYYHLRLIDFYIQTKQRKKAVKAADHVVRVFPDQALAYHALGSAHLANGQSKQALAAYREAAHLDPDNGRYKEAVAEAEAKVAEGSDR